ncbi:MAG: leucyl aminopeptidase [Nitrospirota bacterium]
MEIKTKKGKIEQEKAEVVVLRHFEGKNISEEDDIKKIDQILGGMISDIIKDNEFTGVLNQSIMLHVKGKMPAKRVLLVGLGKKEEFNSDRLRQAMGRACSHIRELGIKSLSTSVSETDRKNYSVEDAAQVMVEGGLLGLYRFDKYKSDKDSDKKEIKEWTFVESSEKKIGSVRRGIDRGTILAEGTNFARDLGNHPSNVVTPERLVGIAKEMAKEVGIKCKILDRARMERLGMGALLGVAKGSMEPPMFIILEYNGMKKKDAPVVLAGKSITFDSGGISLKPSDKMEQMKDDMSGGAVVLGAMKIAAQLKLPVNLVGLLPATENMPGGNAIKPGDVLKTMSGKTIEVINTDAEGRMILSDALCYADDYKPAAVIDIATLTTACVIALGNGVIGAMGNDDRLIAMLKKAGDITGEKLWELPLVEEYNEQIKSDIADVKNVGGRAGGSITAALFLSKFADNYPWVHLDIAGTSWNEKKKPYIPKGATGIGVRLLVRFLSDYCKGN